MTKESLEKEFHKYLKDSSDYYDPREPLTERKLLQMWLDCAEPREKRIEELKAQIDKMKCCFNCKHSRTEYEHCKTDKHEKWELAE